jgi:hypothetical protein
MAAQQARPTGAARAGASRTAREEAEDTIKQAIRAGTFRQRFGAMWRMFTARSVMRVVVLCAVFCGVIGAGAYAARDPHGLFESIMGGKGPGISGAGITNVARPDLPTGAASMADDDPVKQFHRTGIGHVLFTGPSTDNCKRTLFDNRTGGHREVSEVFCGQTPDQVTDAQSGDRLESMRKGFKK